MEARSHNFIGVAVAWTWKKEYIRLTVVEVLDMDFVLWAARVMHVVSVIVWIGGLIFMNAVLNPVLRHEGLNGSPAAIAVAKRFLPFLWWSLWSLLATGLLLMVLNPRFVWFDISTSWEKLLTAKEVLFLLMAGISWQAGRVVSKLEESARMDDQDLEGWTLNLEMLARRSIFLGILALLCAAGMAVV